MAVDRLTGHAELSSAGGGYAVAVPVAAFLVSLWLLHVGRGRPAPAYLVSAVLVLATPVTRWPVAGTALLLAVLVAARCSLLPGCGATPDRWFGTWFRLL